MTDISITYASVDGYRKTRKFKTLAGARAFAVHWVGEHPDISGFGNYAISSDGVGKVTCSGAKLTDLFPSDELQDAADRAENDDAPMRAWCDGYVPHGWGHVETSIEDDDCPF